MGEDRRAGGIAKERQGFVLITAGGCQKAEAKGSARPDQKITWLPTFHTFESIRVLLITLSPSRVLHDFACASCSHVAWKIGRESRRLRGETRCPRPGVRPEEAREREDRRTAGRKTLER